MCIYKDLRDWLLYNNKHFPAQNTIINLDSSIYDDENIDDLELEYCCIIILYSLPTSPIPPMTSTPPSPTVTTSSSSFSF